MEFHVPEHLRSFQRIHQDIPLQQRKLLMPFSEAVYTSFPGGGFLSQQMTEPLFTINTHHFSVEVEPVLLYAYTPKGVIALHFTLEGIADCILEPGQEVRLQPQNYHIFYVAPEQRNKVLLTRYLVSFHVDYNPEMLEHLMQTDPDIKILLDYCREQKETGLQYHPGVMNAIIRRIIHELMHCREEDPGIRSLFRHARVYELLAAYARALKDRLEQYDPASADSRDLFKAVDYIEAYLNIPLPVSLVAKDCALSEGRLRYLFQTYKQQTVGAYIFSQKMEAAMELLQRPGITVTEVSNAVGFENLSSFERAFKRYFSSCPGAFLLTERNSNISV